ncbi:MAG: hypothetical protein ACK5Y2_04085 [Bdellovibrionales bacterium]
MTSKTIHFGLTTLLCLGSSLSHAQSVTKNSKANAVSRASQTETLKNSAGFTSPDLRQALERSQQPWTRSTYAGQDRNQSLETLFNKTADYLKSPQRIQRVTRMGGMDGGGGNALICQENGKFTTRLLDLHEAEQLDIEIDMGPAPDFVGKIEYVLKRLEKVSYARSHIYRAMIADFLTKDTQWVQNSVMPMIDDVKLTTFPRGCLLVQVAVQRPLEQKNVPNARTYIVDRDLFQLLDEESKAALLLHEVMYREARYSGKEDSIFTRHMVGLIASREVQKYSLKQFRDIMKYNGISCLETDIIPSFFSYYGDAACNYTQNYRIPFEGTIRFQLHDQNQKFPETSGLVRKALPLAVHTFEFEVKGTFGNTFNEVKDAFQVRKMGQWGYSFSGRLRPKVYHFNGSATTLPWLSVDDGHIVQALKARDDYYKFPNKEEIVEELIWSNSIEKLADKTQPAYLDENRQIPLFLGRHLGVTGITKVHHPDVVLNLSSESTSQSANKTHFYFDDCLNEALLETPFLVRSGEVGTGRSKDGWHPAHTVCFKDGKVSRFFYEGSLDPSKPEPKEIVLIP